MSAADTAVQPANQEIAQSSAWSAASGNESSRGVDEFLIARGGPYYDLQQRMGLLRESNTELNPARKRTVSLSRSSPIRCCRS